MSFGEVSYAESNLVKVVLNGRKVLSEVSPRIIDNRTVVPIRNIAEELGFNVVWDSKKNLVRVLNSDNEMIFYINKDVADVNGEKLKLDVAPFILEGRTMIPLRFIAGSLNMNIEWVSKLRTVTVTEDEFFGDLSKDVVMGIIYLIIQ